MVDVIETVDRDSLIAEIARRIPGCRIFIQVNVSGEEQKVAAGPDVADLVAKARRRPARRRPDDRGPNRAARRHRAGISPAAGLGRRGGAGRVFDGA
ncbi:MAG: hypothetical protein R2705_04030 [Ilumatobacteraceae bacterium]